MAAGHGVEVGEPGREVGVIEAGIPGRGGGGEVEVAGGLVDELGAREDASGVLAGGAEPAVAIAAAAAGEGEVAITSGGGEPEVVPKGLFIIIPIDEEEGGGAVIWYGEDDVVFYDITAGILDEDFAGEFVVASVVEKEVIGDDIII